jgi:hypothetical protein
VFGSAVIALGVLFMLDNLGIADAGEVLRWWPTVLIAYGVARLSGIGCRANLSAGLLFTLGGSWWLLHNLGVLRLGIGAFWPVMLILVGFSMVTAASRRRRVDTAPGSASAAESGSRINAFAFWSSNERKIASQDFRGGDVTAVMGGHDIDLRNARLADGPASLDLLVWMGGIELFVPEDWEVVNQAVVVMGAIQDQTRARVGEPKGRLVLHGLVLMGGVEIKN